MISRNFEIHIDKIKLTFVGRSRAADATALYVKELQLNLDAGCCISAPRNSASTVLVTHGHADHCFALTHYVSRAKPTHFYCPESTAPLIDKFLFASQCLSDNSDMPLEDYQVNHITHGVKVNTEFMLPTRKNIVVRTFAMEHTVDCVGFGVARRKQKLKPEYVGLLGKELAQLSKTTQITADVDENLFVFCGDTTADVFDSTPELFDYPVIIVECSFLDAAHEDEARARGHVCFESLRAHVVAHPDTTFVLIHFSHRYRTAEIIDFFAKENLANVIPFLSSHDD